MIERQALTSLVNFSLLKNYLKKKRLKVNNIVTQEFYLKRMGIINRAEILSKKMSFKEKSDLYFRLQRLIDPNQMGELFKVMLILKLKKNYSLRCFLNIFQKKLKNLITLNTVFFLLISLL